LLSNTLQISGVIVLKPIIGFPFGQTIHCITLGKRVEIDQVGIELRAIDTGESCFATDQHSAAAAHARAIDHD
jgi:hypothetical protein